MLYDIDICPRCGAYWDCGCSSPTPLRLIELVPGEPMLLPAAVTNQIRIVANTIAQIGEASSVVCQELKEFTRLASRVRPPYRRSIRHREGRLMARLARQ